MTTTQRLLCAMLSMLCLAAGAANSEFQNGINAFRAADHERALEHFQTAHDHGVRTPTLFYNLGATHFQLGNFDESYAAFQQIGSDAEWGALAQYNMGLVEERRERSRSARVHFQAAYDRADAGRVRQLAAAKLEAHAPVARTSDEVGWVGLTSFAAGYDDNVLLTDDGSTLGFSDDEDFFFELFGVASRYVSGDMANGVRVDLAGYYRAHADLDDFDVGAVSAGLAHTRDVGAWQLEGGVRGDLQFAGSDHFTSRGTLRLQAIRHLGTATLRLRNESSYVDGASGFDHLSGWQNQSSIELARSWRGLRLRGGYELELNDRDDIQGDITFSSFSPTHHRLFADARIDVSRRTEVELRVEQRWSRYQDANVLFVDEDTLIEVKRDAERLRARMRASFRPAAAWAVFAEYQYTDNDADIDRFAYESSQVMLGFDWGF